MKLKNKTIPEQHSSTRNGPVVEEDEAILQLIRMILLIVRGKKNTMVPITIKARKFAPALLGIKTLATRHKICYWQLPPNVEMYMEHAGLDPKTGQCVHRDKFNLAIRELECERAAKVQQKYADQDLAARQRAVHQAMQTYRPTDPPKTVTPGVFLSNHMLNNKIAAHLRTVGGDSLDSEL